MKCVRFWISVIVGVGLMGLSGCCHTCGIESPSVDEARSEPSATVSVDEGGGVDSE